MNREAYTFRPDVLFTVGVDVTQGRIVVQECNARALAAAHDKSQAMHYATLHRDLEAAAHLYCTKERTRIGIYRRECPHPKHRIKRARYVVGITQNKKTTVEITQHAYFCTRCGAKVRDV